MYNEKQNKAITSEDSKIVIVAPPGSGKTLTMSGAIDYYLKTHKPKHVVAVTFTNAAASELKQRVFDNNIVHTATIHSWSFKELRKLADKHKFRAKILQEDQIMMLLQPLMKRYGISKYAKWKVYHYAMGNYNIDVPYYMKSKYRAIAEQYIDIKRERHLYDFTDLPLYLKDKLEEYDEYIYTDGIFVDEFQDVDPIQLDVFERVISPKKFFIGDPDQAIYLFRGASSEVFEHLEDFNIYNLDVNYRSYQNILNYATSMKEQAFSSLHAGIETAAGNIADYNLSHIKAFKGDGGQVINETTFSVCYDSGREISFDKFEGIVEDELLEYEPRILCRTNKEVKAIKELNYDNVSTIHKAKGLEYPSVILVNFPIVEEEDINIAYVAATRAENKLFIINNHSLMGILERIKAQLKENKRIENAF